MIAMNGLIEAEWSVMLAVLASSRVNPLQQGMHMTLAL